MQGPKVRSIYPGQPEGLASQLNVKDSRTEGPKKLAHFTAKNRLQQRRRRSSEGPQVPQAIDVAA